jgi:alcohol dehydrogenase (cytochrome c)
MQAVATVFVLTGICGALVAAGAGSALFAQQGRTWEPITEERLLKPRDGDWLSYRRTYDVFGFSPLTAINRDNVHQLRAVWAYSSPESSRWSPSPIVANGIMYFSEGGGRVLAIDVVSGDLVWSHERKLPGDVRKSQAYQRTRGVAVYQDKIYWGTPDSFLVALDARTGSVVWEAKTGDYRTGEGHIHPPLIVQGKAILGYSGGDSNARGKVAAFDITNGAPVWETFTVPALGEPGYETWDLTNRDVPPLGGATWHTPSYDPEFGLVYIATGQPTPRSIALRGGGDALFTNSILALDIKTGKMRWHYQVLPEESWDLDSPFESTLVDLVISGQQRKALVHTSKIGWGVVLDRETGKFIQAFRTGYDNVVTGWTPAGRPIYNRELRPTPADQDSGKRFFVCPHLHGTRALQSPSYSPVTGLYYLGINNACMTVSFFTVKYEPNARYQGMTNGVARLAPGYDYIGEFVAFDPATGQRAWAYRPPSGAPMAASALATAGGIVFGGTSDRQFFALDNRTGKLLWQMRLNGDISGSPVTFEVAGRQYVAVGAGGRIAQTTTLGPLLNVDVPRGSGVIWVFALPDSSQGRVPSPAAR